MCSSSREEIFHKLTRYPCRGISQVLDINFNTPFRLRISESSSSKDVPEQQDEEFFTSWGILRLDDFVYIFDDIEHDMSLLCINTFAYLSTISPSSAFNFDLYDIEPYKLFLHYLGIIKKYIPSNGASLREFSLLWKRKSIENNKIDWTKVFSQQLLVVASISNTAGYDCCDMWRFKIIGLPIVDMEPITSAHFSHITGFSSAEALFQTLREIANFRGGKKTKKYINLDNNTLVTQVTWSKMSFHDSIFLMCSQNEKRFSLIKAILSNEHMVNHFESHLSIVLTQATKTPKIRTVAKKEKTTKTSIPPRLREQVWTRDMGNIINGGKCFCCGTTIGYNSFHCGHIISEFHGGLTVLSNLKAVCSSCNLSMGVQNMKEFCDKFFPLISRSWAGTVILP